MEKIHLSIHIDAPVEKVWEVMFDDASYRTWTTAFEPGSHFKGSWEEGAEIQFLGADESMGMYSRIKENRLHEFVSIEHLGIVKDGIIDTTSEIATAWAPSFENYTFKQKDGGTELIIDQDMKEEHIPMMKSAWDKALITIKELSER